MRLDHLFLITILCLSSTTVLYAQDNLTELYLIKETIVITTDWTDVSWDKTLPVYTSTYKIIEGNESIKGMQVSGLDLWVAKEGFDSTKVTVEIEAIIGKIPTKASLHVEKGDIESTDINLSTMDENGDYHWILSKYSKGRGPFNHIIDLSKAYTYSPGKALTEKTVQDLQGKVFTFYYPWYGNREGPSGEPFHWDYYTNDNIQTSTNYPLLGPYDCHDPRVISAHIALAKQAGINGFIASWWGPNTFEDSAMETILDVADAMDFEISAYYESVRTMTRETVTHELQYFVDNYGDHPAFLHESGDPVIFVYVPSYNNRDAEFWLQVRESVENQHGAITLIADHGDLDLFPAFEAFHTYIYTGDQSYQVFSEATERIRSGFTGSPEENLASLKDGENLTIYEKPYFVTVNPGFWFYRKGPRDLLAERRNGEKYADNWDTALELDAHTVLVTSWNEWHEGTEIEPSREHGFDYLEYTRDYVEQYKQTEIPLSTPEISLNINNGHETHSDTIQITTLNGPLVALNVSISGTGLSLTGDFYSYLEEYHESGSWVQIPYIGAEERIDLLVTYDSLVPPGYIVEVYGYDITGNKYTATEKRASPTLAKLTCILNEDKAKPGDLITISGSINPIRSDSEIALQIVAPNQEVTYLTVITDSIGLYTYTFEVNEPGQWKIRAEFSGDSTYNGSSSQTTLQVNQSASFPINTIILALLGAIIIAIIIIRSR